MEGSLIQLLTLYNRCNNMQPFQFLVVTDALVFLYSNVDVSNTELAAALYTEALVVIFVKHVGYLAVFEDDSIVWVGNERIEVFENLLVFDSELSSISCKVKEIALSAAFSASRIKRQITSVS